MIQNILLATIAGICFLCLLSITGTMFAIKVHLEDIHTEMGKIRAYIEELHDDVRMMSGSASSTSMALNSISSFCNQVQYYITKKIEGK